jgi:uncharacterized coiled-coil protein SlyX
MSQVIKEDALAWPNLFDDEIELDVELPMHACMNFPRSPLISPRVRQNFLETLIRSNATFAVSPETSDSSGSSSPIFPAEHSGSCSPIFSAQDSGPSSPIFPEICPTPPLHDSPSKTVTKKRPAPQSNLHWSDGSPSGSASENEESKISAKPPTAQSKRERNKISASKYRKKRKMHVQTLEERLAKAEVIMENQKQVISNLSATNRSLTQEISRLRKQLAVPIDSLQIPNFLPTKSESGLDIFSAGAGIMMFCFFSCLLFMSPLESQPELSYSAGLRRPGRTLLSVKPQEHSRQVTEAFYQSYWSPSGTALENTTLDWSESWSANSTQDSDLNYYLSELSLAEDGQIRFL